LDLAIDGAQLVVKYKSTTLMIRLIEGKYPNYEQFIPQKLNEKFVGTLPTAPEVETPKQSKVVQKKNHRKRKIKDKENPPSNLIKALSPEAGHNDQ
jgi:DNA polymerase III sliding clamp (beta) subunit (PCNA family)